MSTMALSLPADLFESRAVASVAGLSGAAAGAGTLLSTYLIGVVADRFSFTAHPDHGQPGPAGRGRARGRRSSATPRESGRGLLKAI